MSISVLLKAHGSLTVDFRFCEIFSSRVESSVVSIPAKPKDLIDSSCKIRFDLEKVEEKFVEATEEFESKKKDLTKMFDEEISTQLEKLGEKNDFYPTEFEDLENSLKKISSKMVEAQSSSVQIDFGSTFDDEKLVLPKVFLDKTNRKKFSLEETTSRQISLDDRPKPDESYFLSQTSDRNVR